MSATNTNWRVCDPFRGTPVGTKFSSVDAAYACEGEVVTKDLVSSVKRVTFQGKRYYVKTYDAAGKRLRRYFGRSRIRAEWENLLVFRSLGIETANIVAFGQETRRGVYKRGALVTEEVENAADLEAFMRGNPAMARNKAWLAQVFAQIAEYTGRMHRAGFAHNDLNWRNILVTTAGEPRIYFIDCPSGRFWPWPLLQRRITKDLAHLDKVGRELLSATDRLRFYRQYTGRARLSEDDKRDIASIVHYHDKHRARKRKRLEAWQRQRMAAARCGSQAAGRGE